MAAVDIGDGAHLVRQQGGGRLAPAAGQPRDTLQAQLTLDAWLPDLGSNQGPTD
jgi:hypothetical protein